MNRYDQLFDFRIATYADIDNIMHFIKENWDDKHILANSRDFFEYHYGNSEGGINVFLMCDKKGEIVGMHGFVQYSSGQKEKYIAGSITKVILGLSVPMCGVELLKRFHEYIEPFVDFGCGVNPKTILPLYDKIFKYHTGKMKQYYLVNRNISEYKIITIPKQETSNQAICLDFQYKMIKHKEIEDIKFEFDRKYDNLPFKDKAFLDKRYFKHPIFKYDIYGIIGNSDYEGIVFTRKVDYIGSCIILIVDFIGDINCLGKIEKELERILVEEGAECVSLLVAGMPSDILEHSGFKLIDDETDVIIPTYFEPFSNTNISNYYESMEKDLIIFKASGDQDNPKYRPI